MIHRMHPLSTTTVLRHPMTWILLYLLIHFLIQVTLNQTLQLDDAEQVRHAQHLSLGYPIPQPPLYSWLAWGLFQLFGTSLFALTLLKYSLIALTFWTLWHCSRLLYQHISTQQLALFSLLLMPSFAWHMHQGFTHTILLGYAITATLHAMLLIEHHQQTRHYLYLGAALGVGVMAKYSFLLFMVPLLLAALTIPNYRKRLLQHKIWFAVLAITIITAPHLIWLAQHHAEVFPAIDSKLQITAEENALDRFYSLGRFLISASVFVTPWIVLLGALTSHYFSLAFQEKPAVSLLSRYYLIVLLVTVVLSLFLSMPHFKVRWFHPLMMLFPLWWLAAVANEAALPKLAWHWIIRTTIVLSIIIIGTRLIQNTIGPDLGHYSRVNRPIMESLQQLPHLTSDTLLVTQDYFLGSHLLIHYPNNPLIVGSDLYNMMGDKSPIQCIILWDSDDPADKLPRNLAPDSVQQITTTVADNNYTLHWVITPISSCH